MYRIPVAEVLIRLNQKEKLTLGNNSKLTLRTGMVELQYGHPFVWGDVDARQMIVNGGEA